MYPPSIVAEDFNAHFVEWGGTAKDNKGKNLADLMTSLGIQSEIVDINRTESVKNSHRRDICCVCS